MVRVVALVSALIAQGLLVGIGEPAMPCEEVARIMDLYAPVSRHTSQYDIINIPRKSA